MPYMLVRHKVHDFAVWKRVFDSHAEAQQQAGLRVTHIMRNSEDPNEIVFLFEIDDIAKAKQFVYAPEVPEAKEQVGVADEPNIWFLI